MTETSPSPTTGFYPRQQDLVNLTKDNAFVLAYGSSRGGKSYCFIKMMVLRAQVYDGSTHLIVRKTSASIKTTIWVTLKQVLKDMGILHTVNLNGSEYIATFSNGSEIICGGVQDDQLDKILGSEYGTIFFNEATNISFEAYETVTTRLNGNWFDARGKRLELKVYVDCNPTTKASWIYQQFVLGRVPGTSRDLEGADEFTFLQFDAKANPSVDPKYYQRLKNKTNAAQERFLVGEWADEVEGALFSVSDIEDHREDPPATFDETFVGVDPAMTNTPTSDETGIIVIGCVHTELPSGETRKDIYPLVDYSGRYHPREWSKISTDAAREFNADGIIIEINQGGDSNVNNLLTADYQANVLTVRPGAGQGKNIRAMPIANAMKAGHIHFPLADPERFKTLETQMLAMTGDYDRKDKSKSPDRLDAFVYAAAELLSGDGAPSAVVTAKAVGFWR